MIHALLHDLLSLSVLTDNNLVFDVNELISKQES